MLDDVNPVSRSSVVPFFGLSKSLSSSGPQFACMQGGGLLRMLIQPAGFCLAAAKLPQGLTRSGLTVVLLVCHLHLGIPFHCAPLRNKLTMHIETGEGVLEVRLVLLCWAVGESLGAPRGQGGL